MNAVLEVTNFSSANFNYADYFEFAACVTSSIAIISLLKVRVSLIENNDMFLPLYTFGMIQWGMYGLFANRPVVFITALLQVLILTMLLKRWWKLRLV